MVAGCGKRSGIEHMDRVAFGIDEDCRFTYRFGLYKLSTLHEPLEQEAIGLAIVLIKTRDLAQPVEHLDVAFLFVIDVIEHHNKLGHARIELVRRSKLET